MRNEKRAICWGLIALGIGILLALLIVPAHASECGMRNAECGIKTESPPPLSSPRWGEDERASKIAALAAFAAVDWKMSVDMIIVDRTHYEANRLLGRYPSRRDLLLFGAAGIALTWLATEILGTDMVLDAALSSERWNIEDNVRTDQGYETRSKSIPIIVTWRW
jgi:hypothetical protein